MKTYLILTLALIFSVSISAQSGGIIPGTYSFKAGADLSKTIVKPTPKGGVVFEVETTVMRARGLITDRDTGRPLLKFKNSDGILHLQQLASESQFRNKKGYLRFVTGKGTTSFKYVKGNLTLPGWDEGVAAVVINHEEQYSRGKKNRK